MKNFMNGFRGISVLIIAGAMCLSAAGCQREESAEVQENGTVSSETLCGGYEINAAGGILPDETQKAFDKAMESYSVGKMKSLALLGTQMVAGTNHSVLCSDESGNLKVLTVYADFSGNAEVINEAAFDFTNLSEKPADDEELSGGWNVDAESVKSDENISTFPEDAKNALVKSMENSEDGITLYPQAFLGSQIVAGKNYAFLCVTKSSAQNAQANVQVVTVYEDLSGNSEITSFCPVNAADYNG